MECLCILSNNLTAFPWAWELDSSFHTSEDGQDSGESDGEEVVPMPKAGPSAAYQEFLNFLALGCHGSPLQGYPAVVVILSTIPSSVSDLLPKKNLTSHSQTLVPADQPSVLHDLFASFWAAIDGRALSSLDRSTTAAAFLSSLLECTVFLIRRLLGDAAAPTPNAHADAKSIAEEQVRRVWVEQLTNRLRLEESIFGTLLSQYLRSLESIDRGAFLVSTHSMDVCSLVAS